MERSNIAPARGEKQAPMQFSSSDLTEVDPVPAVPPTDYAPATKAVAPAQQSAAGRVVVPENVSPTPPVSPVGDRVASDEVAAEPKEHDTAETKPNPIPAGRAFLMSTPTIKPIPGYPGYFAGRDGSIWPTMRGQLKRLSPWPDDDGYLVVKLFNTHPPKTRLVSRLVAATFIGPIPEKHEANHLFGNKSDNAVDKIGIWTHQENVNHAISTGLSHPGQAKASRTHCSHGHEFTEANTYKHRNSRHCRACRRIDAANFRARHKW